LGLEKKSLVMLLRLQQM